MKDISCNAGINFFNTQVLCFTVIFLLCQMIILPDSFGQSIDTNEASKGFTLPEIEIPNISQDYLLGYFDQLVKNIAEEASFYDLIGFSLGMVVYGIFIFHFYRFLAKRDIFSINLEKRLRSGKMKASGEKVSIAPRVAAFVATNFFIFPIVIFVWFLVYSIFMFFLAQDLDVGTVFLVVSSLVIAIRLAAYYNEELAKDLAKLIPFTLLGIFLLRPTFFTADQIISRLDQIPGFVIQIAAFLLVAIVLETILSTAYLIKIRFFSRMEKKQKVSDSESAV